MSGGPFNWMRTRRGRPIHVPSELREVLRKHVTPVRAQIAALFGDESGSLDSLKDGAMRLEKQLPIVCQSCAKDIWAQGHTYDCAIVARLRMVSASLTATELEEA